MNQSVRLFLKRLKSEGIGEEVEEDDKYFVYEIKTKKRLSNLNKYRYDLYVRGDDSGNEVFFVYDNGETGLHAGGFLELEDDRVKIIEQIKSALIKYKLRK